MSEGRPSATVAVDDAHFKVRDHFGCSVMLPAEEYWPEASVQAHGSVIAISNRFSISQVPVSLGRCQSSVWNRMTLIDAKGKRVMSNSI